MNAGGLRGVIESKSLYTKWTSQTEFRCLLFLGSRRPGLQCWITRFFLCRLADWLGWTALFVQLDGLQCLSFLIAEAGGDEFGGRWMK
jgi:hypothetical protein